MKSYENFVSDFFKPKMDAKKFTLFLINFINSVIEKDETNYSWGHQFDRHNLITHHIGAKELEGYIFTIKEYNETQFTIQFERLHDEGHRILKTIKEELDPVQEFIKSILEPLFIEKIDIKLKTGLKLGEEFLMNISDVKDVMRRINKNEYEAFLAQKKYNI